MGCGGGTGLKGRGGHGKASSIKLESRFWGGSLSAGEPQTVKGPPPAGGPCFGGRAIPGGGPAGKKPGTGTPRGGGGRFGCPHGCYFGFFSDGGHKHPVLESEKGGHHDVILSSEVRIWARGFFFFSVRGGPHQSLAFWPRPN